jgi:hypothetical protein
MLLERAAFRDRYLRIVEPVDAENGYYERDAEYWVKYGISHCTNPSFIVEIGVRCGYSAWAMLEASPRARYVGYDNYDPKYADEERVTRFKNWATRLLNRPNCMLIGCDTQAVDFIPPAADLYHIDGDHSYEGAHKDIERCLCASHSDAVIAVHDFDAECVNRAVTDAAKGTGVTLVVIKGSPQGDALLFKSAVPKWAFQLER